MRLRRFMNPLVFVLLAAAAATAHFQAFGEDFDVERAWKKSCRKCHDKDGSGGTPAGKKLDVKDYTKAEVQASFTDEEAVAIIKKGVVGEDGKSLMDAYPDFTDEEVAALVSLVRSFAVSE